MKRVRVGTGGRRLMSVVAAVVAVSVATPAVSQAVVSRSTSPSRKADKRGNSPTRVKAAVPDDSLEARAQLSGTQRRELLEVWHRKNFRPITGPELLRKLEQRPDGAAAEETYVQGLLDGTRHVAFLVRPNETILREEHRTLPTRDYFLGQIGHGEDSEVVLTHGDEVIPISRIHELRAWRGPDGRTATKEVEALYLHWQWVAQGYTRDYHSWALPSPRDDVEVGSVMFLAGEAAGRPVEWKVTRVETGLQYQRKLRDDQYGEPLFGPLGGRVPSEVGRQENQHVKRAVASPHTRRWQQDGYTRGLDIAFSGQGDLHYKTQERIVSVLAERADVGTAVDLAGEVDGRPGEWRLTVLPSGVQFRPKIGENHYGEPITGLTGKGIPHLYNVHTKVIRVATGFQRLGGNPHGRSSVE